MLARRFIVKDGLTHSPDDCGAPRAKPCLWAAPGPATQPPPRHCFSANFGFEREVPLSAEPWHAANLPFLFFFTGMDEIKDKFAESDVLASGWSSCEQARAAWRLLWQS